MIVSPFIELAEPGSSLYQLIARAKKRHAGAGSVKQFFTARPGTAEGKRGINAHWLG